MMCLSVLICQVLIMKASRFIVLSSTQRMTRSAFTKKLGNVRPSIENLHLLKQEFEIISLEDMVNRMSEEKKKGKAVPVRYL